MKSHTKCRECDGAGEIEYEYISYQGYSDPCGGYNLKTETCPVCLGGGTLDMLEDELDSLEG